MPDRIESIKDGAFANCESLTSVTIPEGVRTIEAAAVRSCGLEAIIIPESTIRLARWCFASCHGLKSATIGRNVDTIEEGAFGECQNLTEIVSRNPVPPTIEQGDDRVFDQLVEQNATLYVPVGSKGTYSSADCWKNFRHIEEMEL